MDVVVDGKSGYDPGDAATVADLVTRLDEDLRAEGRAVVALRINGEPVSPESLVERFASAPLDGAHIEADSRPISEMVLETLNELGEILPELPVACRKLAVVFQGEAPEQGFEPFNELARIWEFIKTRQRLAASALDLNLSELEVGGLSLDAQLRELNSFLDEAVGALRDGDTVLLGDLLEYELAPRAELESEIVAALKRHAEAVSL